MYTVGSESKLNSWPDSLVGYRIWAQFIGRGLKYHSGQLSMATSKNLSMVNIIYIN